MTQTPSVGHDSRDWTNRQLALGLILLCTAQGATGLVGDLGLPAPGASLYLLGAIFVLFVAGHGFLYNRRRRLGSALTMLSAGLTAGLGAISASTVIGLLYLPAGLLMALGAHKLWEEQKTLPPTPPQRG